MERDYARGMVWLLSDLTGGPFPPYFLEIVMKDGRSFYVASGNSRDEKTNSVVVNVWDLRTVDPQAEAEIKKILDDPKAWSEAKAKKPWMIHPALSTGMLKCTLEDIAYVVQWESRYWEADKFFPKEAARQMGFITKESQES